MKRLKILLILAVVVGGPVLAAREAGEGDAAAEAGNVFAFDLYEALRGGEGNLFLSPYSVHVALAMTREGARGGTASQMDDVLHLGTDGAGRGHADLLESLRPGLVRDGHGPTAKKVAAFELSVANALWGQEGLAIKEGFTGTLEKTYGAPLERIDFQQTAKARKRINDWVAERTRDRILDIIPEGLPSPECLLALANAIYFKASWDRPFDKRWTKEAPFTTASGRQVPVSLMHRVGRFRYADVEDLQVLEIEYRGRETSMLVLLPKTRDGLAGLEKRLDAETVDSWIGRMTHQRVSVKLPGFEVTCPLDLTETLPGMGMEDAFIAGKADFTGITEEEPLFIGAVLHKAFIAVDEAGTEAAAATVVLMDRGGPPPGKPVEFVADHPFFFVIRHRETGCILFMGRLTDPSR